MNYLEFTYLGSLNVNLIFFNFLDLIFIPKRTVRCLRCLPQDVRKIEMDQKMTQSIYQMRQINQTREI